MQVRVRHAAIATVVVFVVSTPAMANKTLFRVAGEPKVVDRGAANEAVVVPIAWQHYNQPDQIHFFLHKSSPEHSGQAVKAGKPLQTLTFEGSTGKADILVPRAQLKELGLEPGSSASLAFAMERVSHFWGTTYNNQNVGTTFAVPNSALRRFAPRVRKAGFLRVAPALRGAPKILLPAVPGRRPVATPRPRPVGPKGRPILRAERR